MGERGVSHLYSPSAFLSLNKFLMAVLCIIAALVELAPQFVDEFVM